MIDNLPPEVQAHILYFICSADDLLSVQCVSKLWYELSEEREVCINILIYFKIAKENNKTYLRSY